LQFKSVVHLNAVDEQIHYKCSYFFHPVPVTFSVKETICLISLTALRIST